MCEARRGMTSRQRLVKEANDDNDNDKGEKEDAGHRPQGGRQQKEAQGTLLNLTATTKKKQQQGEDKGGAQQ